MVLPPSEKCPVVLLRWTTKAQKQQIIARVRAELEKFQLVLVPSSASDILLLTATQSSLEEQAERDLLVKKRRIMGPSSSSVETIMDHFTIPNRLEFCRKPKSGWDADGLFSVHERCQLVLGLLERISVQDTSLLGVLSEDPRRLGGGSTNLRYLLQSHGWVDVITPLHVDEERMEIHNKTMYPIWKMMPPVEEIYDYYGPQIAYYFAFMGFLGTWLVKLGIFGLLSYLFRIYRNDTIDEDEVCLFIRVCKGGAYDVLLTFFLWLSWDSTLHFMV